MASPNGSAGLRTLDDIMGGTTVPSPSARYLTYAPRPKKGQRQSHDYFFSLLGFTDARPMRDSLRKAINTHLTKSDSSFLRKCDNETLFRNLIIDFLRANGHIYWGHMPTARTHLEEPDPRNGFLWNRDLERPGSREVLQTQIRSFSFFEVLESLFDYKAKMARWNDSKRPVEKQIVPRLENRYERVNEGVRETILPTEPLNPLETHPASGHVASSDSEYKETTADKGLSKRAQKSRQHKARKSSTRAHRKMWWPGYVNSLDIQDFSEEEPPPYKILGEKRSSSSQPQTSANELSMDQGARPRSTKRQKRSPSSSPSNGFRLPNDGLKAGAAPSQNGDSHRQDWHKSLENRDVDSSSQDEGQLRRTRQIRSGALASDAQQQRPHNRHALDSGSQKLTQIAHLPSPNPDPGAPHLGSALQEARQHTFVPTLSQTPSTRRNEPSHSAQDQFSSSRADDSLRGSFLTTTPRENEYHQENSCAQIDRSVGSRARAMGLQPNPNTSTAPILTSIEETIPSHPFRPSQANIVVLDEEQDIHIKQEPLSQAALDGVILQVTDNVHKDMNPEPVPLASCAGKTSDRLFATLLAKRGLVGRQVDFINVVYSWNNKKTCLKRNDAYLWESFCRAIRKAWETRAEIFGEEECEVEMELHVGK